MLIGDRHGNVNVSEGDGFSKHGSVAFSQEPFEGNGVLELGQLADPRFFGTMLFDPDDLDRETVEKAASVDYGTPKAEP